MLPTQKLTRAESSVALISYFGAVFGQTRAVCLDGFSGFFVSLCPPITTTKEEGFLRRTFSDTCLPLGGGFENVKEIQ